MSITQVQQQIKEREVKIAQIQQSKTGFEQQLSTLRTEEHSLIVSARTGDEAAKTRLAEVRQGISAAEREIQDDAAAISRIASEVENLRAALAREQFEAARQKLLREVSKFAKRAEETRDRISAAAQELREIGDICVSEAKELRGLLTQLHDGDRSLNAVTLSTLSVKQSLAEAAAILQHGPQNIGYDCLMHMDRFITGLKSVTRHIEREAEPVPEPV
jgi:chromosome segregation ATPase